MSERREGQLEALLQSLVTAAYRLALEVHYEDVPEGGSEEEVLAILSTIRERCGIEPQGYRDFDDRDQLLGSILVDAQRPQEAIDAPNRQIWPPPSDGLVL